MLFCKVSPIFSAAELLPIQVSFQQPTYLLQKDQILDTYECDSTKPECKVNLDITPTFWDVSASSFNCHIDFWFETPESEKCNPGTVSMPVWETHVHIQVFEKNNPSNVGQREIVIKNTPQNSNVWMVLDASETVVIPDILYTLQTPSYIEKVSTWSQISQTGSIDTYVCDTTKPECSVNISLEDTFGWYIPKKFACEIAFWFVSWEENNCNPNTVTFPEWDYIVTFKIYELLHPENAKSTSIKIIHSTEKREIPEPIITVQSGLSLVWEMYECRAKDCTVNFSAQDSFTGGFVEQNYTCSWDFWSGSIQTSTSCNPWYIHFSTGEQKATLSIYSKEDASTSRQTQVVFHNPFFTSQTQTGSTSYEFSIEPTFQTPSSIQTQWQDLWCDQSKEECKINISLEENLSWAKASDIICRVDFWFVAYDDCNPTTVLVPRWEHILILSISHKDVPDTVISKKYNIHNTPQQLSIPQPIISIQSGIIQASSWLVCKNEKCSINVSALENFTGSISPEKIGCEWDMGGILSFTGASLKSCNPWYISFPEWVHTIRLKLYEKEDISNFSESLLVFQASTKKIQVATAWAPQEERKIQIQSGLVQSSQWYVCEKEECKVNVKFPSHTYEACTWNFGTGKVQRESKSSCNPWIVSFWPWEHNISLVVTDEKSQQSYAYTLQFQNLFSDIPELYSPPIAQITVDGKLSKNKVIQKKNFICYTQDTCSLNLSWKESFSLDRKNLEFYWDFWDGETSTKANPKAKKFLLWTYTVVLKVSDGVSTSQDVLTVQILKKWDIPQILEDAHIYSSLKIKSLFPNPEWKDSDEWVQLENTSWNILHLKWLIIHSSGDKKYTIEESIYLLPRATKKFYKDQTHLSLKNQDGEVSIWYNQRRVDFLFWSFPVRPWSIITRESLEISSQKVQVLHVIDGDTLSIVFDDGHSEKLRLIGVDTPETKHPKKKVQEFGKEAFEFTRTSLEWQTVFLQIEKQNYRDKYGRLLGYIRLDGQEKTFNQILIEKGYARAYLYFPFVYSEVFKKAEKEAKEAKVWLWADKELIKETLPEPETLPPLLHDFSFSQVFETLDDISYYFQVEQYVPKNLSRRSTILALFWEDIEHKKVSKLWQKTKQVALSKKEKIPFSLKLSLLKSWVKVSGKTKPLSLVKVHIFREEVSLQSDSIGKFSYLYTWPLVEWQQLLKVQIFTENREILKEKEKIFTITPEYKTAVLLKKQKAAAKLKNTKKKSTKKKGAKKVKSIPFLTTVSKNFQETPQKSLNYDMIFLYIFIIVWCGGGWWYILQWVLEKRKQKI